MTRVLLLLLAVLVPALPAGAQADRRDQIKSPGLVLDAGGPTGITRGLQFTADGKFLLAAGEDKVVRQWPVADGKLDRAGLTTLRWRTWHEWRGAIYCMALSPDAKQKYVAVGGYGAVLGEVTVIDRATGKTVAALVKPDGFKDMAAVTTAVAFSPDADKLAIGTDAGGVFVWEFTKKEPTVVRVGTHGERKGTTNQVHRLHFAEATTLVSAAQDGRVLSWPLAPTGKPDVLARTDVPNADASAHLPGKKLLAVGGRDDANANRVQVLSLDGKTDLSLKLPADALGRVLAFSPDGTVLAVGVELPPEDEKPHSPQSAQVWVCDITADAVTRRDAYPLDYFADAVAFSPDGKTLAVAGGADFAVRLIDVKTKKTTDTVRGAGLPLWGVGFDARGTSVGVRTKRKDAPRSYNDWAEGDWLAFDLKARKWADGGKFAAVEPVATLDGWSVQARDRRNWRVVNGDTAFDLPLVYKEDALPRCYTFVAGPNKETRLAVGHKWGFSLFEVTNDGVRRIRVGYGHGSTVTAIAPSADGQLLLTAGRDQTVCCFSLKGWDHQADLGATFATDGAKFVVTHVADGSPAWEAGLSAGDEVVSLAVANVDVERKDWAAKLKAPAANVEHFFEVRRRDVKNPFPVFTSVRQRPLWKFAPLDKGEWVLWRWRDYYYDCSANGDAAVGWQVNGTAGDTPTFLKAEQMRKNRHRPEKVSEAVATALYAPEKAAVFDLLPPTVEVTAGAAVGDKPLAVTVRVKPAADGQTRRPQSVSLWVNDHKFDSWPVGELADGGFEKTVQVPAGVFRSGPNVLIAQAYDQRIDSGRGESAPLLVAGPAATVTPKLHGLFVGVADYSRTASGPQMPIIPDLIYPVKDAERVKGAWERQAGTDKWAAGTFALLTNQQAADPKDVLAALKRIAAAAEPDDLVVFHISGHGWARPPAEAGKYGREAFAFVGPQFDVRRYQETGLTSEALYDALAAIPARKLLLLDACHSGGVVADGVRALTPEGRGPAIITAARADEVAFEHPSARQSLLSRAVIDALTRDFAAADGDSNGRLEAAELGEYSARRVPELLAALSPYLPESQRSLRQHPQVYPPAFAPAPAGPRPVAWEPTK